MNRLIGWSFQRCFSVQGRAAAVDLIVRWYHAQLTSKPPFTLPKDLKKLLVVKHSLMGKFWKYCKHIEITEVVSLLYEELML